MTDRELLELAAKAAGIEFVPQEVKPGHAFFGLWLKINGEPYEGQRRHFNPLTDDGDAFRLAVKLRIDIEHGRPLDNNAYVCSSRCGIEMVRDPVSAIEEVDGEAYRAVATRRAITRAAAEIGRGLSSDPSKREGGVSYVRRLEHRRVFQAIQDHLPQMRKR